MTPKDKEHAAISASDQELVLGSLERDQLAGLKRQPIPRRRLRGSETLAIWSLRIYVVFMMIVVLYQVLTSGR